MHFYPKTRIGKISFWVSVTAFALIYIQYWIAMLFEISIPPFIGVLPMLLLPVAGTTSIIALTKNKDHAILLILSVLIGFLGLIFVMGEFILPH